MTQTDQNTSLKYPIGPFVPPAIIDEQELGQLISTVESAPRIYSMVAADITTVDSAKCYREGSWNVRQLFNHVADMQMLHFFRMKKALTEPDYKEITLVNMDGWANTEDGRHSPIEDSLVMFEAVTRRYVLLMRSLTPDQQSIEYYHPVRKVMLNQKQAIAMSAWHVRHHREHLRIALGR